MSRKHKAMENTKKILVDAYWKLLQEKRAEKISIKDITEKAGYNRGTFYRYFEDIYAIQEYFESSLFTEKELVELEELIRSDTIDKKQITDLFVKSFSKNVEKKSYLIMNNSMLFQKQFKDTLRPLMKRFLQANLSNEADNKYIDYEIEYILSGLLHVEAIWYKNHQKDEMNPLELMDIILHVIFHSPISKISTIENK